MSDLKIDIGSGETVSAIYDCPVEAQAIVVLGHGSSSNLHASFITHVAAELRALGIGVLRFNYPYSDAANYVADGSGSPDDDDKLLATMRSVIKAAGPERRVYAGGHSMSGIVGILGNATGALNISGAIALGYPALGEAVRRPAPTAAAKPALFVQGTRDPLGSVADINAIVARYSPPSRAHFVTGAGHGFDVEGREFVDVSREVAGAIKEFIDQTA